MDKSYYKNQIKIMFSGQNTFSTINTYDTNAKTQHCFSAYDNHYINPASILAFRDSYFNILNNEENRQKSVICVGGYYKHYYDNFAIFYNQTDHLLSNLFFLLSFY